MYVPGLHCRGAVLGGGRVARTDPGHTMIWNGGLYVPGSMFTIHFDIVTGFAKRYPFHTFDIPANKAL